MDHLRIVMTAPAERDLRDIWRYIEQDNPEAATVVALRIIQSFEILSLFPHIGRRVWRRARYRSHVVGNYIVRPLSAYTISTDPARLDVALIHRWLSEKSYWAPGIPRDFVERAIAGALTFGIYHEAEGQVGFARVISDRATFAYLADVFVLESHRGKGLSKRLMEMILAHPDLQGLRRWLLATRDAHTLYEQFGFTLPKVEGRLMERTDPDVYRRAKS